MRCSPHQILAAMLADVREKFTPIYKAKAKLGRDKVAMR